jgi:predicted secreted Zn-dependent protease
LPEAFRLEGGWLVRFRDGGKVIYERLLVITPTCAAGPCDAIVSVSEPRFGLVTGTGTFKYVAGVYRFEGEEIDHRDCEDAAGQTIEDGLSVTRTASLRTETRTAAGTAGVAVQLVGTVAVEMVATADGADCEESEAEYTATGRPTVYVSRRTPEPGATPGPGATAEPRTGLVELPRISVEIEEVEEIDYYPISGTSPLELAESMAQSGPAGDHPAFAGEQDVIAQVEIDFDRLQARTSTTASGTCTMTGLTGEATYRARMPRWARPPRVQAELLAWWRQVLEHIRWHEEQHILIAEDWIPKLAARVTNKRCSSFDEIAEDWSEELQEQQLAFDRRDASYRYPVYTGP